MNRKNKISYSFLKILTGSDLSKRNLPLMTHISPDKGPVIWLTGCMHGDEVGGIVIIQEIFKILKNNPLKRGSLYAFPLLNPIGFETGTRNLSITKEDMNRSFPGSAKGTLAQRIANLIMNTIIQTEPALVLDLHNDWINSVPYALVDKKTGQDEMIFQKSLEYAKRSCLPVVIDTDIIRNSLTYNLLLKDIPALTFELGQAFFINEFNVSTGISAVIELMASLDMLHISNEISNILPRHKENIKTYYYSGSPVASTSGIIRYSRKPGTIISQGMAVARIYNIFGKKLETLHAEGKGIFLGHSDFSVVYPGMQPLAFGYEEVR